MRDGVSKRFQFLVDGLEVAAAFRELLVERAYFHLPALSLGDVIVGFEDRRRAFVFVAPQSPAARYHYFGSVGFGAPELALPTASPADLGLNILDGRRENRVQKFTGTLADGLLRRPTVHLLCA